MTTETSSPRSSPSPILDQPLFQNPDPPRDPKPNRPRGQSPGRSRSRTPSRSPNRSRSRRPSPLPPPPDPPADAVFYADAPAAAEEDQGTPVRDAIREIADAGAHGAGKKRDATQQDWEEFLGALFGFASMLLVLFLVVGRGWKKEQRREFELTDTEAEALAAPAGRILARSWINAKWGKHILGGADWIVMALTLADYTERVSPLLRERLQTLTPPRRAAKPRSTAPPSHPEENNGQVVAGPADQQWQPYAGIRGTQFT
jgi:hypothetical protein